jgi:hypothetical protein
MCSLTLTSISAPVLEIPNCNNDDHHHYRNLDSIRRCHAHRLLLPGIYCTKSPVASSFGHGSATRIHGIGEQGQSRCFNFTPQDGGREQCSLSRVCCTIFGQLTPRMLRHTVGSRANSPSAVAPAVGSFHPLAERKERIHVYTRS